MSPALEQISGTDPSSKPAQMAVNTSPRASLPLYRSSLMRTVGKRRMFGRELPGGGLCASICASSMGLMASRDVSPMHALTAATSMPMFEATNSAHDRAANFPFCIVHCSPKSET